MGEMENEGGNPNDIHNLVADALAPTSGEVNEPFSEHENLAHEARVLKDKLATKRRETAEQNHFETEVYGAAYYLADALDFVLNEAPDVSRKDPENDQSYTTDNVGRDMFVNSIKRALNHLGMDGDGVKELLQQENNS